VETIQRQRESR